jgi:hypothetical protein
MNIYTCGGVELYILIVRTTCPDGWPAGSSKGGRADTARATADGAGVRTVLRPNIYKPDRERQSCVYLDDLGIGLAVLSSVRYVCSMRMERCDGDEDSSAGPRQRRRPGPRSGGGEVVEPGCYLICPRRPPINKASQPAAGVLVDGVTRNTTRRSVRRSLAVLLKENQNKTMERNHHHHSLAWPSARQSIINTAGSSNKNEEKTRRRRPGAGCEGRPDARTEWIMLVLWNSTADSAGSWTVRSGSSVPAGLLININK